MDLFLWPVVVLLLVAALFDVATMEIPDWISIALALAFAPAAFAAGMTLGAAALHVGVAAVAFVVVLGLFQVGVMGGGDAKLLTAAALWAGPSGAPALLIGVAIAGGALAAVMLCLRRIAHPHAEGPAFLNRLLDRQTGLPYAVAIAFGVFASLPHFAIAAALH
jgi:prepilin peptidase CpaA